MLSLLTGLLTFTGADQHMGVVGRPIYTVVDGRQRTATAAARFAGDLAVPSSHAVPHR